MIKLEHVVLPSIEQMGFVIEGMRNPMNSWNKSDSGKCNFIHSDCDSYKACIDCPHYNESIDTFSLGQDDLKLAQELANAGADHRKFMRMMPVMVRITAPLYWWKEFDTYKVGTVTNSCSTMHKIAEKEFTLEDFSCEHLLDWNDDFECDVLINKGTTLDGYPCGISPVGAYHIIFMLLNEAREKYLECDKALKTPGIPLDMKKELVELQKQCWWQLIQLLPSSYNQTRNVMLNYEVLSNIYHSRKSHKLDEWVEFCKWIEELPYASNLILHKNHE